MTVYRVFDDEWEMIAGDGQIREFAMDQLYDKAEIYIEEHENKDLSKLKTLWKNLQDGNYTLTLDDVRTTFECFDFDFEVLNIY